MRFSIGCSYPNSQVYEVGNHALKGYLDGNQTERNVNMKEANKKRSIAGRNGKSALEIDQKNGENPDKPLSDFKKRMNERRDQMKETAVINIDKAIEG